MNDLEMQVCKNDLGPRFQGLFEAYQQAAGDASSDPVQTYLLLLSVLQQAIDDRQAFFSHFGVSEGKLAVLMLLKNAPDGRLAPSEIAEGAFVTRATVTGLLVGLERSGLVARVADPLDGRRAYISLTAEGERLLSRVGQARIRHITGLFSCYSAADLRTLRALLMKLGKKLSSASPV